ncbi:transcriptional regulator [Cnuibacter physcomitrellae]|uniref:Transcriptional regulator n=1 Tax=Cnuibacter physcomitrellae TaxID=1619308 RepID=A0A1X9LNC5_9MICO|nr:helix-turn-helix transcriptional regulator [Cnuibacter physcomitrellae]ARJ06617.1 transcriptional regulator [Cnuibacter physcomitrellae]GGI38431.1 transcriptional regulator [Cnuibacter physcomitrellae]
MGEDRDNPLGEYLKARRALVSPAQVGLPGGPNRRVSGLRREEVALLAGISADYYLRLERGRDANPSAQVLEALARVLQLDDVERDYLLGLTAPRPRTRPRRRPERVPARVHDLLASIGVPAFVEGRTYDVLASNALAVAFSPRLQPGRNRLRDLLLDPEEQAFQSDWAAAADAFIATFRGSVGDSTNDARVIEIVGELSVASERFRAAWARHDVRALDGGATTVHHPLLGDLQILRDKLPIGDVILVVYYAEEGSESAEKLTLLGSLAAPSAATPRAGTASSDAGGAVTPAGSPAEG